MRIRNTKYDVITIWGEYEQQCEMEVIYSAQKVEQINYYIFIDTYKCKKLNKYWREWNNGKW